MERKVPELKLASYLEGSDNDRIKFIDELYNGLKEYGFFVLKEHPVSVELLEKAYGLAEDFFMLSSETKKQYVSLNGGGQRGYTPFGVEHAKDQSVADLKEFYHVGRELVSGNKYYDVYPQNLWPKEVAEFKETFLKIYNELDRCGEIILEALTHPLELPKNYFSQMVDEGNSILRLLHYPPLPEDRDPNAIRAAAHEDINLITLLVSASAAGLELQDHDGKWLPIESDPNSIIVDSGDMLSRATNDVLPSTTHRVVNPSDSNTNRYSMPFFMHPHPEAMLTCIDSCKGDGAKYEDITANDFLMQRLKEIGLTK